jgi:hypothetical protein
MTCSDVEYFLERAITEREMAKAAKHPNAVAAHEELALRYDALIKGLIRSLDYAATARLVAEAASRTHLHSLISKGIEAFRGKSFPRRVTAINGSTRWQDYSGRSFKTRDEAQRG